MSATVATAPAGKKYPRIAGILLTAIGVIMIVVGIGAWGAISAQLREQHMVVPDDAPSNAGKVVAGPFTAWSQQEIISIHANKITDGVTYSELGKVVNEAKETYGEDSEEAAAAQATRDTALNAAMLRSSLFTSILAFGVSLLAVGTGVVSVLGGSGLIVSSSPASARRKVADTEIEVETITE